MLACEQHILYVFPGQGSQYRGMGGDLYHEYATARRVYEKASGVLGYDIAELSFNDPEEQLNQTRFTQPALLTHSIACLEVFRDLTDDRLRPAMAAGHSLGEYSALVAAKALSFESALKLVQRRGELMGAYGEGEMSAFHLDLDTIRPIAERYHCAVAGCNLPDQTVIGGRGEDLARVEQEVKARFARKRPVRLKTEGAFHTYYMVKAAQHFRSVLETAEFALSEVRVLSNFTGGYHESDPVDIRARLFFQLFHPVLWHANLQTGLSEGIKMIIEFGGGIGAASDPGGKRPSLEGMTKKTLRASNYEALYLAAINRQSLKKAAGFVCGINNLLKESHDDLPNPATLGTHGTAVDENWFHLFVPTQDGVVNENTANAVSCVSELGLSAVVQIIRQPSDENLACLEHLVGEKHQDPNTYLEEVIGGETGAVLYYTGEEMEAELVELQQRLRAPGYGFREES
jgi:malonyl CoA-acyl carrier protein transacylase